MGKKSIVLHDESVNTYGFRMLTSGANLDEFRKNPVMLLNHDDWSLPIGRWDNIRIEGTLILADPVFDEADPRAMQVKQKYDNDFIRMASIGAWPPEQVSDEATLKLSGQTGATVLRWTVREASIVTIGSNHNALAFYDRATRERIDLNDRYSLVRLFDSTNQNVGRMTLITGLLKLQDGATEADQAAAVQRLISDNERLKAENVTLSDAIDRAAAKEKSQQKQEAVQLVDAAIRAGKFDAKGKDSWIALFDKDFNGTKAAIEAIPERASVAAQLRDGHDTSWLDKPWNELDKAGRLTELKDKYPDRYAEKFEQRFGCKPTV